jgi:hypothetical protein
MTRTHNLLHARPQLYQIFTVVSKGFLCFQLQPVWECNRSEVPLQGDQSWLDSDEGKRLAKVFSIEMDENTLRISNDNLLDTQALYLIVDAFVAQDSQ